MFRARLPDVGVRLASDVPVAVALRLPIEPVQVESAPGLLAPVPELHLAFVGRILLFEFSCGLEPAYTRTSDGCR